MALACASVDLSKIEEGLRLIPQERRMRIHVRLGTATNFSKTILEMKRKHDFEFKNVGSFIIFVDQRTHQVQIALK